MKEKNVDNVAVAGGCLVLVFWMISVLFSLGLTGVVIWAIYELVTNYVIK